MPYPGDARSESARVAPSIRRYIEAQPHLAEIGNDRTSDGHMPVAFSVLADGDLSMVSRPSVSQGIIAATLAVMPAAASAQSRSDENAVTQAEDAFGFSVGRESLGIYNSGNARGFSPSAAGNLRIEGLYFDQEFGLQGTILDSQAIKVGLSAQGYPFAAPSGIVDQSLRKPGDKAEIGRAHV